MQTVGGKKKLPRAPIVTEIRQLKVLMDGPHHIQGSGQPRSCLCDSDIRDRHVDDRDTVGGVRSLMMCVSRVEIPSFHMMIFTHDLVHSVDKHNIDNIRYHLNFDLIIHELSNRESLSLTS